MTPKTEQKKTEVLHVRWEVSEADKVRVYEHAKLTTAHEKGGIPCRTRYDAKLGD